MEVKFLVPQVPSQCRQQFRFLHGLCQIGCTPAGETLLYRLFTCPERQHHDRNQRGLLPLPQSPTYFQPICARHHYVHENQVGLFGVGQFQRLITALRAHNRVVGIFRNHDSMHQSTRRGIVDQENFLRQGSRSTLGMVYRPVEIAVL
jgi:hypothetical protein